MRYVITGGTGFIGRAIGRSLLESGHRVQILTRDPSRCPEGVDPRCERIAWTPGQPGLWESVLEGADGVINLAGKSLFENRWNDEVKEAMRSSRVDTTRVLVEAMGRCKNRPPVLVNASAVGYYGPHGDEELNESSPAGTDYLSQVCVAWEEAATRAEAYGIRVVRIRIGIVLGKDGGALSKMVAPFTWYFGGRIGSGGQWMSWIHVDDLVGMFRMALERNDVTGAMSGTAPDPKKMRDFCSHLGAAMGRPSWFPTPGFMLRLMLGEVAEILLNGQKVLPAAAIRYHFPFRFPSCESALEALLGASS